MFLTQTTLAKKSLDFSVTQETRWAPHWADSKLKSDLPLDTPVSIFRSSVGRVVTGSVPGRRLHFPLNFWGERHPLDTGLAAEDAQRSIVGARKAFCTCQKGGGGGKCQLISIHEKNSGKVNLYSSHLEYAIWAIILLVMDTSATLFVLRC